MPDGWSGFDTVEDMKTKKKPLTEEDVFGKNPILKALDKRNITVDDLAKKLREELDANETKFFAHQGQVIEMQDVTAWFVRQKARMDAHKLRGDYPAEKKDVGGDITVNINATPIEKEEKEEKGDND